MIFREDLALKLFEVGAIKFGAFKLKLHEKNPDAPLSPIYLNLRTPPKGPLTEELVTALGGVFLHRFARLEEIPYQGVVGVPNAGEPFATAFAKASRAPQLWLDKKEDKGKRTIVPRLLNEGMAEVGISKGDTMLLVDDLITEADSKLEAIEALQSGGLIVKDVLVLVDREQGGREALARVGITLHAAWQITGLLEFYRDSRLIDDQKYVETIAYIMENRS